MTIKEHDSGPACFTLWVVAMMLSAAPHKNLDPLSITRDIMHSDIRGGSQFVTYTTVLQVWRGVKGMVHIKG